MTVKVIVKPEDKDPFEMEIKISCKDIARSCGYAIDGDESDFLSVYNDTFDIIIRRVEKAYPQLKDYDWDFVDEETFSDDLRVLMQECLEKYYKEK